MKGDQNGLGLVLFFILFCFDPGLFFCPGHDAVPVGTKLLGQFFERAKFADGFGSTFSLSVDIGLGDIKRLRVFRFCSSDFHGNPSQDSLYHILLNIAI